MEYSFVLLAYNQEDFISEAVTAALGQEGPPLEILLSDDASTDRTFEIIQGVANQYEGPHKIILNRNSRNIGTVAHIRKALSMSTGEVIIAASGDDVSLPDRCRSIIEVFLNKDVWLVHSHADCIDLQGNAAPATYLSADLIQGADLKKIAVSEGLYLGASAAFHRKLLRKYGYISNPRAYEDLVYGFRASLEGGVRFIDRPLLRYRIGSGISTSFLLADAAGMRKAEIRRLRSQLAVLAQRRRDAMLFGLKPRDELLIVIRERRLRILLELYYLGVIAGRRFARMAWWHPFVARSVRKEMQRKYGKVAQSG